MAHHAVELLISFLPLPTTCMCCPPSTTAALALQVLLVILDRHMHLGKIFRPEDLPLYRGWAYAGHYDYLIGTDNTLAMRHVPDIPPRCAESHRMSLHAALFLLILLPHQHADDASLPLTLQLPIPPARCSNDTVAGRVGRRGDRVGGPYFMHRDDMARVAPLWLNWTRIMRDDRQVRSAVACLLLVP